MKTVEIAKKDIETAYNNLKDVECFGCDFLNLMVQEVKRMGYNENDLDVSGM